MEEQATKRTRSVIRDEAYEAWVEANYHGLIGNCTGSGKSSIAIKAVEQCYEEYKAAGRLKDLKILLATYTLISGEKDWPDEFRKWKKTKLWKYVQTVAYASLGKIPKEKYALIILDEAHHITDKSFEFFNGNQQARVLMLTATPPKDDDKEWEKAWLLMRLGKLVYTYKIDEGVADGNLSDYRLWIVDVPLDSEHKYVKAGSKLKGYYYLTEQEKYEQIMAYIAIAQRTRKFQWAEALRNQRMHFLSGVASKTVVARQILAKINEDKRVLIFTGSKKQCDQLCEHVYYTGATNGARDLELFRKGKINRLASVRMLNESVNIQAGIDKAIITQTFSNEREVIQRIGRLLRYKEGLIADIFLLRTPGTQDAIWIASAIADLDPAKIFYYHSSNLNN